MRYLVLLVLLSGCASPTVSVGPDCALTIRGGHVVNISSITSMGRMSHIEIKPFVPTRAW